MGDNLEIPRSLGVEDAVHAADRHMARVDLWLDDLPEIEDQAERRIALSRVVEHARASAEAYGASTSSPWPVAEARLVEAIAAAALADMEQGAAREQRVEQAARACRSACAQVGEGERGQLSLAAGIWAGCAEALLQIYALSEGNGERRAALEGLVAALGEATGEALAWDRIYRDEGRQALFLAQVAQAVADLEEDPRGRLLAAQEVHQLALTAGAYLQQTGDLEEMGRAYDLIHASEGAVTSARVAVAEAESLRCPQCGRAEPPGARFCGRCGARLA